MPFNQQTPINNDLNQPTANPADNFIIATIDRLENECAVLKTDDGQEIIWPIDKLSECREGETVRLVLQTDQDQTQARKQIAKDILNHILNQPANSSNESRAE